LPRFETPTRPTVVPEEWLTFHLAHPGPVVLSPHDPNCIFYWGGRYHLHYIYKDSDGYAFAHVSSEDMVRWTWHPTTLAPSTVGHGMWSGGGFITRDGRPAIIYHGSAGDVPGMNYVTIALDDQLESWSTPMAVNVRAQIGRDERFISNWDPEGWREGDNYYAIFGNHPTDDKPSTLYRSEDLKNWDYLGVFLQPDLLGTEDDTDLSGPNFFPLGSKHVLLCISHSRGLRYYIGEWKDEKFTPEVHGRMNWNRLSIFAVESVQTPDGRRVMWAWCPMDGPQAGVQSLPRELELPDDGILRISPLRELESLRGDETSMKDVLVNAGSVLPLSGISGDALELQMVIRPGDARRLGVRVHSASDGRGGIDVVVDREAGVLAVGDVTAPFELGRGEDLRLRVFIDKNVLEVFANERQSMVASHQHLTSDVHLALICDGDDIRADVSSWPMNSIYENP
jgi:sucrose-6-phosphate hydrolase SacC (GH32 family)